MLLSSTHHRPLWTLPLRVLLPLFSFTLLLPVYSITERNATPPRSYAFHMKKEKRKRYDYTTPSTNVKTDRCKEQHNASYRLHAPHALQIRQRRRPQVWRGNWWPRPAPPPPLPLVDALRRCAEVHVLPELAANAAHPVLALVRAEPVLGCAFHHDAADLAAGARAIFATLLEGVLGEICAG